MQPEKHLPSPLEKITSTVLLVGLWKPGTHTNFTLIVKWQLYTLTVGYHIEQTKTI